ncbi:aldose epimerase family protein [Anaeromicropila populeti]|uniref:Aldose 1-epimerase n=1 Tax=Anaeromicropila populeti TaxID=37658 RepID=A0A1I6JVY4_9FIRM|nr:aldose epimerase family protein [Anaeromicropila populeti]SFR83165.1 aldose 1-epimerase [Anaeromicropila populeti]
MLTKKELFGYTKDGQEVFSYTLSNDNGMSVTCLDYGAVITKVIVPDRNGKAEDVVLGFENVAGYEENGSALGSFIGRHANRIAGGKVTLGGKLYQLLQNDRGNNLHGGIPGYNKVMYEVECFEDDGSISIEFSRLSPDMEQGFPGNLDLSVTYSLTSENELVIEYVGVSDQETVVNLTNHSYFNLGGHNSGSVLDQQVKIYSNQFLPTDDTMIPTGVFENVEGTPMDFRTFKKIGQDINCDYKPLKQGGGYDHNYVLDTSGEGVELVAELYDEKSGRVMEVYTDLPGLQLYSANFLEEVENGKEGAQYHSREGVCFETQFYPNACNMKEFPSSILPAGQEFNYVTVYKFKTN